MINLDNLGLIFGFVGGIILLIPSLRGWWSQPIFNEKQKRYWWNGRRPIYKTTDTKEWKFKWGRKVPIEKFISPQHQCNIIGITYLIIGIFLELIF